ncbi:SDR family NAD(P)-dependent oxidoreductase [Saccharothrix isguenensis]
MDYEKQTVLVTGASAGIGSEFAHRLARRGAHLVLVARRKARLEELASRLRASHGVQVHVIAADLSRRGVGTWLAEEVRRLGVTVTGVVNNAGFATYGPFHEEDPERLRQEIAVDVSAVVDISRAFIGQLRTGGDGFLVNVASMAAYAPSPLMSVYGATKAFVLSFTEALSVESRGTGLRVMALSPGATRTEFFDVVGTGKAAGGTRLRTAEEVVTTALKALDRKTTPASVIVGRGNRVTAFVTRHFMSRAFVAKIIARMVAPAT